MRLGRAPLIVRGSRRANTEVENKDMNVVHLRASRCRTDVFYDCAVSRLFVDIVKLPLKPPQFMQTEGSV